MPIASGVVCVALERVSDVLWHSGTEGGDAGAGGPSTCQWGCGHQAEVTTAGETGEPIHRTARHAPSRTSQTDSTAPSREQRLHPAPKGKCMYSRDCILCSSMDPLLCRCRLPGAAVAEAVQRWTTAACWASPATAGGRVGVSAPCLPRTPLIYLSRNHDLIVSIIVDYLDLSPLNLLPESIVHC